MPSGIVSVTTISTDRRCLQPFHRRTREYRMRAASIDIHCSRFLKRIGRQHYRACRIDNIID